MKKCIIIAISIIMGTMLVIAATPTITDVTAQQRYPWNGLVDITCKVSGIEGMANGFYFNMAAVIPNSGDVREVSHFWVLQSGTNSSDRRVYTNGNYQLLWDLRADLGQVRYSNLVVRITAIKEHGKVQLWEGGPYWSETNIGAEEPWEYGYYFWWGDVVGYERKGNAWVASNGSSSDFSFSSENTPTYKKNNSSLQSEGWITADSVLAPEYDAAHMQWGGAWRMPTMDELTDLNSKCDWTWTTMNGVKGFVVRGREDFASASIFLPAAGRGVGTSLNLIDKCGYYLSSAIRGNLDAYCLSFSFFSNSPAHSTGFETTDHRYYGRSIRPVQGFTE